MTDFFDYMGKPISGKVRMATCMECLEMGLTFEEAVILVDAVANALEKDEPGMAQRHGLASPLDLTGYFRLAATLLAGVATETAAAQREKVVADA